MTRLTPEQHAEMIARYNAGGVTQAQLAADYGVSVTTVNVRLRQTPAAPAPAPLAVEPGVPLSTELAGVTGDWRDDALCAQTDPEIFFPDKGGSTREAKAVCARCDVRAACLADALATDDWFGVRGGLSERQRRAIKKGVAA
jgi:WhiB family redox-sensing transcriptional regulator